MEKNNELYSLRPLEAKERNYVFAQAQDIQINSGLIGYLRADFGSGEEFYSTWNDFLFAFKTDEFKAEFDKVINSLREKDGILSNRSKMSSYCYKSPESSFKDDSNNYGIRVDTDEHSYLMRLNPNRGEYNLYCYCYVKDFLDTHMKKAEKGIRFFDSEYNEKFRIADGDKIKITYPDGKTENKTCRFINEYHAEIGWSDVYCVYDFDKLMEEQGCKYEPLYNPSLSEKLKQAEKQKELSPNKTDNHTITTDERGK